MPTPPQPSRAEINELRALVPPPSSLTADGLTDAAGNEDGAEKLVDKIEMIGEEAAAGFRPGHSEVSAGMRYLHSSRTIHQLVTDRNRAVGLLLAVASLLLAGSGALLNANPKGDLLVPLDHIQCWCLPLTFAVLTVLSVLAAFLLIRTRVGLIYEVAKMNALLGLPIGRVQRVNVFSVFFIMQFIVSLAGGLSAGLLSVFLLHLRDREVNAIIPAVSIGTAVTALLIATYVITVLHTTSDQRLQSAEQPPRKS